MSQLIIAARSGSCVRPAVTLASLAAHGGASSIQLVIIAVVLLLSISARAQAFVAAEDFTPPIDDLKAYTARTDFVERGLSNRSISCLMQDSRGYIWIGSGNGLNRFDGYEFTVYAPDPRDSNSISDTGILALCEGADGLLWVGTIEGRLNSLDRQTGAFTRYEFDWNMFSGPGKNTIVQICRGSDSTLWLGTSFGSVYRFNPATGGLKALEDICSADTDLPYQKYQPRTLVSDAEGRLYYLAQGGLVCGMPKEGSLAIVDSLTDYRAELGDYMHLASHGDQHLLVLFERGIGLFDCRSQRFSFVRRTLAPTADEQHVRLAGDGKHVVWTVQSDFSILRHNLLTGERRLVTRSLPGMELRNNSTAINLLAGRDNTLWLGIREGLCHIYRPGLRFEHFCTDTYPELTVDAPTWFARAMEVDTSGVFWLGTDYGIFHQPPGSRTFHRGIPGDSTFLVNNSVNVVRQDSNGYIWFGHTGQGITAWNPSTGKMLKYTLPPEIVDSSITVIPGVYSILVDQQHNGVWLGSSKVLYFYSHDSGVCRPYRPPDRRDGDKAFVFYIAERNDDSLWLATNDGIRVFDRGERRYVKLYSSDDVGRNGLSNNAVWSLLFSDNNTLWAGTYGHGLNCLRLDKQEFSLLTEENGLSNNVIYGIMEDERGYLWISTGRGLSRYNPRNNQFKNYDQLDGLLNNENYFGAYLNDRRNGKMYIGGLNGCSRFDPDEVMISPAEAQMVITETRILDKPIKRELFDGDTLELQWNDNFVSFRFASLDYTNPKKHQYAYMLDGVDRGWVYSGARRYAAYTDLAGGTYTFRIKGTNSDRIWNNNGIAITLLIQPEPWTTPEFRIAILLLCFTLVFWVARSRFKRAQQRAEVKRKLLESELEALRMQMNPHFLFNSLTSVQHFIMRNNPDTARDYIARFARLMRMVVETANRERITLSEELEILETYLSLERERFQQQLQYSIHVDPEIDPAAISIPPMLLQPYVENAIVHGLQSRQGKGNVNIDISRRRDRIVYKIEDDGVGRSSASREGKNKGRNNGKRSSLGMLVTDKRISMLNEALRETMHVDITDLYDEDGRAGGTRVEVFLPAMNNVADN